jgi:hypothetical protein
MFKILIISFETINSLLSHICFAIVLTEFIDDDSDNDYRKLDYDNFLFKSNNNHNLVIEHINCLLTLCNFSAFQKFRVLEYIIFEVFLENRKNILENIKLKKKIKELEERIKELEIRFDEQNAEIDCLPDSSYVQRLKARFYENAKN